MPAPTIDTIKRALTTAFLDSQNPDPKGSPNKTSFALPKTDSNGNIMVDSNGNYSPSNNLTPATIDMIHNIATAINLVWVQWQAAQSVVTTNAPGTTPGPTALP